MTATITTTADRIEALAFAHPHALILLTRDSAELTLDGVTYLAPLPVALDGSVA